MSPVAPAAGPCAPEHLLALGRYNQWMNQRLYVAAGQLSDAQRKAHVGAFFGSVHDTLAHVLWADLVWLGRVTGSRRYDPAALPGAAQARQGYGRGLCPDFADLECERAALDASILQWVEGLTPTALQATVAYGNVGGTAYSHPLWWVVAHFFNHQTHHRGQVAALLHQAGVEVGVTDLMVMLRREAAGAD